MKSIFLLITFLVSSFSVFSQTSRFATSGNVEIHYQTIGKGAPILIINGGPGFNSEGFKEIAQKISDLGYQTILYDQRGTGKSVMDETNTSTITMDLMTQDIEAIRTDMGIEKWIIFGHSFGGIMANYYASKHPECITAIIHSSSGGIDLSIVGTVQERLEAKFSEKELEQYNYWRRQYNRTNDIDDRRKYVGYLARAYVYDKKHAQAIAERLLQGNMSLNRLVWSDLHRINYDCKPVLKNFNQPVLILQGKNDIIGDELAIIAHDVFPNSKKVMLDNCGHYGWLDREEKYMAEINTFLSRLNP